MVEVSTISINISFSARKGIAFESVFDKCSRNWFMNKTP